MAQLRLLRASGRLELRREDGEYVPVELAIRTAISPPQPTDNPDDKNSDANAETRPRLELDDHPHSTPSLSVRTCAESHILTAHRSVS